MKKQTSRKESKQDCCKYFDFGHPLFVGLCGVFIGWCLSLLTPQITERSDLKLQPYFSVANYLKDGNLYFLSYINATNRGKKAIGLRSAKLEVILNKRKKIKLDTVPIFPRFHISKEARAPTVDQPFFYDAEFYENAVKDKEGQITKNYDYHPKSLTCKEVVLKQGEFEDGYLFFKLEKAAVDVPEINSIRGQLVFGTTEGEKKTEVVNFKRWAEDKFYERFFIITDVK